MARRSVDYKSLLGETFIPKLPAYIVDIDGTLAINHHRGPYQFSLAGEDTPNRPVVDVVNMLAEYSHSKIIITTGRSERFRSITENWLNDHLLVYSMLLMRADGDNRPDWMIKSEMYEEMIEPTYEVRAVFDDRQQVVDMWRRYGLTCMQVAKGDF